MHAKLCYKVQFGMIGTYARTVRVAKGSFVSPSGFSLCRYSTKRTLSQANVLRRKLRPFEEIFLQNIPQIWQYGIHCFENFKKCSYSLFWNLESINEFIILRYFSGAHIHWEYSVPHPLPLLVCESLLARSPKQVNKKTSRIVKNYLFSASFLKLY